MTVLTDDFNRSNQKVTDSSMWIHPGWDANEVRIRNEEVKGVTTDSSAIALAMIDPAMGSFENGQVHRSKLKISNNHGSVDSLSGPALHFSLDGYYLAACNVASNEIAVYTRDHDNGFILHQTAGVSSLGGGDEVELELEPVVGEDHPKALVRVNGATILSIGVNDWASNKPVMREGEPGIQIEGFEAIFDDFEGNDGEDIVPTLTRPVQRDIDETTARVSVETDIGNGTVYMVITRSSTTPTAEQVASGEDHNGLDADFDTSIVINNAGIKTFTGTGLQKATEYWPHFMHEDNAGNRSEVFTGQKFATEGQSVAVTIKDREENIIPDESNVEWWVRETRGARPRDHGFGSTDSQGVLAVDIPNTPVVRGDTVIVEVKLDSGDIGIAEGTVE